MARWIPTIAAAVIAGCGVTAAALHVYGWEQSIFRNEELFRASLIGIISVLLIDTAVDRVLAARESTHRIGALRSSLTNLQNHLESSGHSRALEGGREVYAETLPLVERAESKIQSVIFGIGPKAPPEWAQGVAARLRRAKKEGHPVKYEALVATDFDGIDGDFIKRLEKRRDLYQEGGVGHLAPLNMLNMKPPLGLDIMVVDARFVAIAFAPHGGEKVHHGLILYDHPKLAAAFSGWIDEQLLSNDGCMSYEQFLNSRRAVKPA